MDIDPRLHDAHIISDFSKDKILSIYSRRFNQMQSIIFPSKATNYEGLKNIIDNNTFFSFPPFQIIESMEYEKSLVKYIYYILQ